MSSRSSGNRRPRPWKVMAPGYSIASFATKVAADRRARDLITGADGLRSPWVNVWDSNHFFDLETHEATRWRWFTTSANYCIVKQLLSSKRGGGWYDTTDVKVYLLERF